MLINIKTFLLSGIIFTIIDFFWLKIMYKKLYANNIGHLLSEKPNIEAAIIFYLIFIFCLGYFVINPALKSNDTNLLLKNAILFGLITYGTYDLTNQATLKNWPTTVTTIDILWGITISTTTSILTFIILR